MTIPYLTAWTTDDLAFLRTSIEDAERCPTCKGAQWLPDPHVKFPPRPDEIVDCDNCQGSGKVPASPTHSAIDWLQERLERLPQMGVDSCMTEVCNLYAKALKCGVVDCNKEAVCIGGDVDRFPCCDDHCAHDGDGSESCTGILLQRFPLSWLLALARIWVRTEKCPECDGHGARLDGEACPECKGTGTISPDRERVERMKDWRVVSDGQNSWLEPNTGTSWHDDNPPEGLHAPGWGKRRAEQELRRRVLAEFSDCGRTAECPKCHGSEGWSDGDDWEECPKCIEGKLVIRPQDFRS